jgi:DUF1365 family protein
MEPGVFVGTLRHRRFSPVAHAFTYPLFMALLDVDRIPELMRVSRLTSHNRWNWAAFDDRDHLGDPERPLRERLAADAAAGAIDLPEGRILLLTHLRYLGYCFNPVSFFYCFDRADRLTVVLAEVNNTFGGSHRYWLRWTYRPSCRATFNTRLPSRRPPLARSSCTCRRRGRVRPASTRRCRSSGGHGRRPRSGGRSCVIRR